MHKIEISVPLERKSKLKTELGQCSMVSCLIYQAGCGVRHNSCGKCQMLDRLSTYYTVYSQHTVPGATVKLEELTIWWLA